MKKIVSLFLSIIMISTSILCVDLSAFASDVDVNNRAQWLSQLAKTFEMNIDSDNYPDNYFSDLTEDSEYYYDVLLAVEFGVVDIEAGDPVNPEGEITREFAAQTLNACLKFELENADDENFQYTFIDYEQCEYPNDDQIAVNRGWLALDENNQFCPDQTVTSSEIDIMLTDAQETLKGDEVDENYNSTYELKKEVKEIPSTSAFEFVDDNNIIVYDKTINIKNDDTFVIYSNEIPLVYVAENVIVNDDNMVITVAESTENDIITDVDIQDVVDIDANNFIPAEGVEIVEEPSSSRMRTKVKSGSIKNEIKLNKKITLPAGNSLNLDVKISDIKLSLKLNAKEELLTAKVDCNLSVSVDCQFNLKDIGSDYIDPDDLNLGEISIAGVGYVKFEPELNLSGKMQYEQKYNITVGFTKDKTGIHNLSCFNKEKFSFVFEASCKLGVKVGAGLKILTAKIGVYFEMGAMAKATAENSEDANKVSTYCLTLSAYLYINVGVEYKVDILFFKNSDKIEWQIYKETNSPVRLYFHFENGESVDACTVGSKTKTKYTTPLSSKYGSVYEENISDTSNIVSAGDFEISTSSDGTASIIKYTGSAKNLSIPEYINGYRITSIKYSSNASNNVSSQKSPFYYCQQLESISLPASIEGISDIGFDKNSFCVCKNLLNIYVDSNNNNFSSLDGVLYNKSKTKLLAYPIGRKIDTFMIPNTVTDIGLSAFRNSNIKNIIIPNSVTCIGAYAFLGSSLTNIGIPNSVTSIGSHAFYGSSLTNITIPDNTCIGAGLFINCKNLETVTLGKSVTQLKYTDHLAPSLECYNGRYFSGCINLKTVILSDSITTIDNYTFADCKSLVNITIDSNNKNYSSQDGVLFNKDKTALIQYPLGNSRTSYSIPDSVRSIGAYAFYDCNSLNKVNINSIESWLKLDFPNEYSNPLIYAHNLYLNNELFTDLIIPNGVTSIGRYAFKNCTSLTSITIPDSVTSIGAGAFDWCYSLNKINISSIESWCKIIFESYLGNRDRYTYNLYLNNELVTDLVIPNDVTSINQFAFYGCRSLKSVTIPDSVTSIGAYAFVNCIPLTSIIIPDSVTNIGNDAFAWCSSLTDVFYTSNESQWNKISIGSNNGSLLSPNVRFHYNCNSFDGHIVITEVIEPTCTSIGYTAYACPCGYSYNSDYLDALGHSCEVEMVAPTCTLYGYTEYHCTRCGDTCQSDFVNALGHNWVDKTCTNCGETTLYSYFDISKIDSISFEPVSEYKIMENTSGDWTSDCGGNNYYFYYPFGNYSDFKDGDTLTALLIDGSEETFTYHDYSSDYQGFFNDDEEVVFLWWNSDQYNKHWKPNESNEVTLTIKDEAYNDIASTTLNVIIFETPYSSITYVPANEMEIIENTNGSKETDNDGNEYYSYHSLFSYGDRIILITKDGKESVYTYQDTGVSWSGNYTGAEFSNESGNTVQVTLRHNQSSEHWNAGNQYEITVDCCGLTTTTVVSINESPIASISFIPIKLYEIIENTHGYYWLGNDNSEEFYYNIPNFNHGDVLTVTDKDGTSVNYVFNDDEYSFVSEDGKVIDANLLNCNSEQYANPWAIGGENYFTVEYMGATVQLPVTIIENPVTSISFTPAKPYEIIENTHGEWNYSDDDEKYFCYYTPWFNQGDVFTIIDKDGNSVKYTLISDDSGFDYFISEDGSTINTDDINLYSNQYSNPWTIGEENYFTIEYMGAEIQVPVTIVENPVASISFTPVEPYEIIENTHGYWDEYWYEDEEGNEQCREYWCYHIPSYQDGDILTIIDKDGNSVDYIFNWDEYVFVSEDGNIISEDDLSCYYNQYYNNQWVAGGENCFIIEYMGATANVPVSIVQCDHQYRVEIHEPTCVSDGYTYYYCEICGTSYNADYVEATGIHTYVNGFCKYCLKKDNDYILPTISVGETKNVNIENGGDYCYFSFTPEIDGNYIFSSNSDADTYGYLYDSDMNELYSNDDGGTDNNFSIKYDFEVGKTYIFACRYYQSDRTGSFDVSLIENPVKSIEFTPSTPYEIIENTLGYWDDFCYEDENGNEQYEEFWHYEIPEYNNGDKLTVVEKDGARTDYIFDEDEWEFISANGDILNDLSRSSNQYSNHWTIDGGNYFTIGYMGAEVQVPVTIVENPVSSIEYTPVNGFVNSEGITYAPADGGTCHFRDGYVQSGDKLTVNYKNAGIKEYFAVFDNQGFYEFITNDGEKLDENADFYLNENDDGDWNNPTSITVNCYGKSFELPISAKVTIETIEFIPIKPITIIESNGHENDRWTWTDDEGNVIYGTNVYWGHDENDETTIESEIFNIGDVINVTYSNGKTANYTYYANRSFEYGYAFIGDDESVFYVGDIRSNQNEQPWTIDSDNNYFTINFSNAATEKIPVTIVRNIDTDALIAAIEKFSEFDSTDYSEISYSHLKDVVDKNKGLIDTSQSQEEVDRAVTEILEAIYDLQPYLNFTVSAENGSYEVSNEGNTSSESNYSLLFGTEITLSATANDGYEFVGWYDVINNLYFSKESTYTFKITSNTNLKAVFAKKQSATLTFNTYSNWVQSTVTKTIDEWSGITSIDDLLPEVPYRYGYSNGRWVYDNADVLSKLQTGESVFLIPEYDEDDTSLPTPRESVDGIPVLDLYYKLDADANVGSFVMAAGIPDDCQIESVGVAFYYKKANTFDPTKFELLNNNKMLVSRFNTDEIEDIYIVNMNKFTSTYNWAARGYVTYYDADGNLKTAYSNQINIVNMEQV